MCSCCSDAEVEEDNQTKAAQKPILGQLGAGRTIMSRFENHRRGQAKNQSLWSTAEHVCKECIYSPLQERCTFSYGHVALWTLFQVVTWKLRRLNLQRKVMDKLRCLINTTQMWSRRYLLQATKCGLRKFITNRAIAADSHAILSIIRGAQPDQTADPREFYHFHTGSVRLWFFPWRNLTITRKAPLIDLRGWSIPGGNNCAGALLLIRQPGILC